MARFLPGQSGNPSGRLKSAKGLRGPLIAQYGPDAGVLVRRLEALSTSRNPKIAFAATQLLVACHAGKPEHSVNVAVTPETDAWTPVQMAMLTSEELEMMLAIRQRLGLQAEEHAALLPPGRPERPVPQWTPPVPSLAWWRGQSGLPGGGSLGCAPAVESG